MPREQLQGLIADVDRLLAAGGTVAAGDANLQRRGQALRDLGRRVSALVPIADAVDRVTGAGPREATRPLLDLLLIARGVRSSLTGAGVPGTLEPAPACGPWRTCTPSRDVAPLVETLAGSGGGRATELERALERGILGDLRLVGPILENLDTDSEPLARVIVNQVLPAFGEAILPELRRYLNLRGSRPDARRLAVLCKIDPGAGLDLCRTAIKEGQWSLQVQGLESLAEINPAEAERTALELLSRKIVRQVRGAALKCLGASPSDAALELLLAAIPEAEVIWAGARAALVVSPHPQVSKRLLRDLQATVAEAEGVPAEKPKKTRSKAGQKPQFSQENQRRLAELGGRAGQVMEVLVERGDRQGIAAVLPLLKHRLDVLTYAADSALNSIGPRAKASVPLLLEALEEDDEDLRGSIALALGQIGTASKAVVPALVDLLRDRRWYVRSNAADALQRCGKVAVPALIQALTDEEVNVRTTAAGALGDLGEAAVEALPALLGAMKDRSADVRHTAARAVAALGPVSESAVPALIEALKDPDSDVRHAAVGALASLGSAAREAVPGLAALLKDRVARVRGYAAVALRDLGPEAAAAVPALTRALKDRDKWVRARVTDALAAIGGP